MGVGVCICKCLLVVINIFFIIFGIVFLALGVVLKVGGNYIKPMMEDYVKKLGSISSGAGVSNTAAAPSADTVQKLVDDILGYANGIAVVLIIFGIFMFVMGCLGCCGACCVVKIMLIIYIVVVLVLWIAQVVVIAMLMTGKFDGKFREQLKKTINEKYGGVDDYSAESLGWNAIMAQYKCCGLDSSADFDTATKWKKTRDEIVSGFTIKITLKTPVMCCKMDGTFPNLTPKDKTCAMTPTDVTSNWKSGCWKALGSEISNYKSPANGICAALLLFELLLAILAILLLILKDKEKVAIA